MSVARPFLALTLASVFGLAATAPARAGLFSRNAECAQGTVCRRCEWEAEFRNARRFEPMTCAELTGYAESYRMRLNQQILNRSFRPVAESARPTSSIPQPRPLPPSDSTPPGKP